MRVNLPVTQHEFDFPEESMLVSSTDTKGIIVHCNPAFIEASGYSHDELVGQPHNLIRHPDMPPQAFKDMWSTVGRGHTWTGLVKNRRKDGGFYWVRANVTPIMEGGKPRGYLSVRTKPGRAEVQQAEALYARLRSDLAAQRETIRLHHGRVVYPGMRGALQRLQQLSATQSLALMLLGVVLLGMLPRWLGWQGALAWGAQLALMGVGCAGVLAWFHGRIVGGMRTVERFAGDIAGCNLVTTLDSAQCAVRTVAGAPGAWPAADPGQPACRGG